MRVNKVSAFRVKRGLRRGSGAEAQVVGLPPQTTDERKADTMKTYILRRTEPVEPQKAGRGCRAKATMAHKLARIIWHLIAFSTPYDPAVWETSGSQNQIEKIETPPTKYRRPR